MTDHLDEELLELALAPDLPVAAGGHGSTLDAARAHLASCAACGAEVARMREALAALPLALAPVTPSPGVRDHVLAAALRHPAAPLHARSRFAAFVDATARLLDVAHDRARELLDGIDDAARWVAGPLPGIRLYHVEGGARVAGAVTGFVRLSPGAAFPHHRHVGDEDVLVLQGAFRDDDGRVYGVGEQGHKGEGTAHSFEALPDEELIFLAVVVGGLEIAGRLYSVDEL